MEPVHRLKRNHGHERNSEPHDHNRVYNYRRLRSGLHGYRYFNSNGQSNADSNRDIRHYLRRQFSLAFSERRKHLHLEPVNRTERNDWLHGNCKSHRHDQLYHHRRFGGGVYRHRYFNCYRKPNTHSHGELAFHLYRWFNNPECERRKHLHLESVYRPERNDRFNGNCKPDGNNFLYHHSNFGCRLYDHSYIHSNR